MTQGYEKFQDACDAELEDDQLTMTPGHDEAAAQIFARQPAWPHNETGIMSELLETGSVTVHVAGQGWVVSLDAKEDVPADETDTYRQTEPPLLVQEIPIVENWSLTSGVVNPYQPPELQSQRLRGRVMGDDRFPDGMQITTSPVINVDYEKREVQTRNTLYKLGKIDPQYAAWIRDSGVELKKLRLEDYE